MGLPGAYNAFEKQVSRVSRTAGMLAVGILAVMMLFTVSDVFLRYFFNRPILGSLEITVFMMVCVGCLGLSWAAVTGAHVKVDLIVSKFPLRVQKWYDIVNYVCVLAVCGLVGWRGFEESQAMIRYSLASDTLHVPFYPFYWVLTLGFFLLFLVVGTILVKSLSEVNKR